MVIAARNLLPHVEVVAVDSPRSFFTGARHDLSGLVLAAQEGAAWTVLYPEYTVVVPRPLVRKPVGMAIRTGDSDWLHFLDRWLDYERLDGALDRLRVYWVEGGGTQQRPPRWSVTRDVLQWFP
jgi:ABC-type amino acid transport substrate-binding protein